MGKTRSSGMPRSAPCCLPAGRAGEALQALRAAVALGAAAPVTRLNLALAEAAAGDGMRAGQLLVELEAAYPSWSEPPLRLAEMFRARSDMAAAEAAYDRALAVDPGRQEALLGLGSLLVATVRGEPAKAVLKRCCAPPSPHAIRPGTRWGWPWC